METKRAFCHHSSSKLTQSIIEDHMVSHYKKLYTAKAAIDTSVPKSLNLSVKYKDQIKQAHLKHGGRPHSAHSVLQSSRISCSSAQSRLSLQYDKKHYLNSRSSIMSSPRFSSSFHAEEVVSPWKVTSQDTHLATKLKHKSPQGTAHRKESPCSLATLGNRSPCRFHQDPMKKTYNGDLLQKHSHIFTPPQPFTPKTLKSDKTSYLSKYRYYRAPQRKPKDFNNSRLEQQKANLSSTQTREETSLEYDQPSQEFSDESEGPEEEFIGPHFSASRGQNQTSKSKVFDLYNFLFRDSPEETTLENTKSPVMKRVCEDEEELVCLQFISAVTSDILSRGYVSDRIIDMVFRRHFDMNLYNLKEDKMCHLLENLRKDIQCLNSSPSVSRTAFERDGNDEHRKSREDRNLLSAASLTRYSDSTMCAQPLLASTPVSSPDTSASLSEANEKQVEDISQQTGTSSPQLSEHGVGNIGINEEVLQQEESGTALTNTEDINVIHESTTKTTDGLHPDQTEECCNGQPEELEDLRQQLSDTLHVSSDIRENNMDVSNHEQYNNTVSVSDDEF